MWKPTSTASTTGDQVALVGLSLSLSLYNIGCTLYYLPNSLARQRRRRRGGREAEGPTPDMRFPVATVRSLAHRSRFAAAAAAVASFGTVVGGGITMLESARTPLPLARVVSYNVLSSHLCGADHYIKCKPEDLDPPTRRKRVEALLSEHMDKQAVICLQEVSVQWVGELTPFFERAGYTFVTGNYGNAFNGYMGVALAWPTARFTCEEMSISKLADTKPWPEGPK